MSAAVATATATTKTVLVVEDEQGVRDPLVYALKNRGFHAEGAADVPQTRRLIHKLGQDIDVTVLDMNLQDPYYTHLTGADLGREVRRAHPELPSEFLVFSGHREPDYYDAAFQLGIAAYLVKGTLQQEDLIRHIRSLALRRALNTERKETGEKIEQIAEKYKSNSDLVVSLCRQVIEPEIRACLGAPAIFLFTDSKGTRNCAGDSGFPLSSTVYDQIQTLTFAAVNNNGPFVFKHQNINLPIGSQSFEMSHKLDGGGFLPLHMTRDYQLSVGILQANDERNVLPENPDKLAGILWAYLRQPINELFNRLSQMEATIEKAKRRALLEHTSRFCLYVGQTQLDVLNEAMDKGEVDSDRQWFQKLKKLASDLQATGNEFSQLSSISTGTEGAAKTVEPISVASVVQQAWDEIEEQFIDGDLTLEQKGDDFNLAIERKDLLIAVLRVIQWMTQRADKIPAEVSTPIIEVEYAHHAGHWEIRFADHSRRLGSQLRQKLFDPFTQATTPMVSIKEEGEEHLGLYLPLYLAKTLIEVKNNGSLEDRSDEREDRYGHLFVMSFAVEEENNSKAEKV